MEWTMMWEARIDASIATFVMCVGKYKRIGCHHQKLYEDTYGYMRLLAVKWLIGNVRVFVENYVAEELQIVGPLKCTEALDTPSKRTKYIWLGSGWFSEYMCDDIGSVHAWWLG